MYVTLEGIVGVDDRVVTRIRGEFFRIPVVSQLTIVVLAETAFSIRSSRLVPESPEFVSERLLEGPSI